MTQHDQFKSLTPEEQDAIVEALLGLRLSRVTAAVEAGRQRFADVVAVHHARVAVVDRLLDLARGSRNTITTPATVRPDAREG